jgi:hypothetical protein
MRKMTLKLWKKIFLDKWYWVDGVSARLHREKQERA